MNNLLLIQPDGSRQRLLQALSAAGKTAAQFSFIDIQPTPVSNTTIPSDAIIWVSKNAVRFAHQAQLQLPSHAVMYAVGPATAKLAAQYFHRPCLCPTFEHTSEGLLGFAELQAPIEQRISIIKGEGGRTLLSETLTQRHAEVTSVDVYQRVPSTQPSLAQWQDWQQNIDTIVVTSAEQLQLLLATTPEGSQAWLQACHWVLPSDRLRQLVPFIDTTSITITQSATENAMIKAILNNGS